MIATRNEVYAAIDTERTCQESVVETDPNRHDDSLPEHSVGDYLTMLATYVRKATDIYVDPIGLELTTPQVLFNSVLIVVFDVTGCSLRVITLGVPFPGLILSCRRFARRSLLRR